MEFTLIVCTYQRPQPLLKLLNSVVDQNKYPDQILIIDGSRDARTKEILQKNHFRNIEYYKIPDKDRGLTRQRNFGINKVVSTSEIVCFLDDDIVLTPTYFENLLNTYLEFPGALGAGGYIIDEVKWERTRNNSVAFDEFQCDGWKRKLGSRNVLRKKLQLLSNKAPGHMPESGNGFSTGFLPPSGKTYPVEFFMGGVSSYRQKLFQEIEFSNYFEGYGLYEDMDFCLRASKLGQLYVNTSAMLYHYHQEEGRPNNFRYGKMVIRNGWYVWRLKYPNPFIKAKIKWHMTGLVLIMIRWGNVLSTNQKRSAFDEAIGRTFGWVSLLWDKPHIQR